MQPTNLIKAGLLALFISLIAIVSWEFYLRHKGISIDYDSDEALWADKRAMVYEPSNQATVFIGSSRIKFDLDIPTWQAITGDHAIQLANEGSSPRPVLVDLANDKNFKGRLIVDVTEGLFFNPGRAFYDGETYKKIKYFKERTPTQRFSFLINHALESQFVFLDQDNFSLNAMLDNLQILPRPGVFPGLYFPMEFDRCSFDRQSYMAPRFVADTSLQNQVKAVWAFGASRRDPPISGNRLDSLLNSVKVLVDKIKSRGGQVLFVRTPSSGFVWQGESKGFPRAAYWDRLLAVTACPGIYFADYPVIAHFECPECSHLKPDDAVIYTKNLIKILQEEKEWSFIKNPITL